jgi:hypothetical protein
LKKASTIASINNRRGVWVVSLGCLDRL